MTLDLDRLAALEAAAPPSATDLVMVEGNRLYFNTDGALFYDALRNDARALIAAAREREGLAALVEGKARMNAAQRGAYADLREQHIRAVNRLAALARAVRAQAAAQAAATRSDSASWVDFVSADVARLLEGVGDGE